MCSVASSIAFVFSLDSLPPSMYVWVYCICVLSQSHRKIHSFAHIHSLAVSLSLSLLNWMPNTCSLSTSNIDLSVIACHTQQQPKQILKCAKILIKRAFDAKRLGAITDRTESDTQTLVLLTYSIFACFASCPSRLRWEEKVVWRTFAHTHTLSFTSHHASFVLETCFKCKDTFYALSLFACVCELKLFFINQEHVGDLELRTVMYVR